MRCAVCSDTICDLGYAHELCNYGEYSGAPTEQQTYEYAKALLSLMTSSPVRAEGKLFLIGGGIANFTNVATTFKVSYPFDSSILAIRLMSMALCVTQ